MYYWKYNYSDNKENLTGVKVSTKNEIIYTDFDGNFKINISDTLWIEFISYEDSIIVLKDSLIAKF